MLLLVILLSICLSRGVHRPVSESTSHYEAETPRERALHQYASTGQGGDEGSVPSFSQYNCLYLLNTSLLHLL